MKFQKIKIAYMTLVETLIAVSLLSLLLVFIFGFFRQFSVTTQAIDKSERQSFQIRYMEVRLGFIFERIVNENAEDRIFYFYTERSDGGKTSSDNLVFTFNNEARLDPLFSSDVLGKIYLDDQKRLVLAVWPLLSDNPKEHMQEEVLAYGVKQVKYAFYFPPHRIKDSNEIITNKKIDTEKKEPQRDLWHQEWFSSYDTMPALIKISVVFEHENEVIRSAISDKNETDKTVDFFFVLPSSRNPVNYPAIKELKNTLEEKK